MRRVMPSPMTCGRPSSRRRRRRPTAARSIFWRAIKRETWSLRHGLRVLQAAPSSKRLINGFDLLAQPSVLLILFVARLPDHIGRNIPDIARHGPLGELERPFKYVGRELSEYADHIAAKEQVRDGGKVRNGDKRVTPQSVPQQKI